MPETLSDPLSIIAGEALEQAEYGGSRIMNRALAVGVLEALRAFETDLMRQCPWDKLDALLFVVFAQGQDDGRRVQEIEHVTLHPLELSRDFWTQGDTPVDTLMGLARQAAVRPEWFLAFRQNAGVNPRRPVVGWGFAAEAYVAKAGATASPLDDPSARADEVRTLTVVDADQRVYAVERRRSGRADIESWLLTPREWAAKVAEVPKWAPGVVGLPRVPDALGRLARLTATEVELLHMGDEPRP